MFLNRNLITAEEHATTNSEASGIFDLQSQSVLKQAGRWPAVVTTVYEITYTINNTGTSFTLGNAQTVNMTVDWGDGSAVQTVTTNDPSHTYASAGTYQIKLDITGAYMPEFVGGTNESQVTAIDIGSTAILGLGNHLTYGSGLHGSFRGMTNMTSFTAASAPYTEYG